MIGQHSTYLEVGRCCSAETRQPDSPRPSTSASSCNRFDFARPLVSTDVYAVPLNRTGAPTRRVPLVGISGMKILERNRTNEKKVEFADVGSWLGDRPLWMKLRRFFFFIRRIGSDDDFHPRVQPTRGWKLCCEFVSRKIAGVEEGACLSFSKLRLSRRYPSPFFLVSFSLPPSPRS